MADFHQKRAEPSQEHAGRAVSAKRTSGCSGPSRGGRGYARSVALPDDDPFDERPDRSRRISQVTRRDIFDYLRTEGGP